MIAAPNGPSTSELAATIGDKRARCDQVNAQRTQVRADLAALQNEAAQSVADGKDPKANTGVRIRELEAQDETLGRALNILEADVGRLQHDLKTATRQEAIAEAVTAEAHAVTAAEALATLMQRLVTSKALPAITELDVVFETARTAKRRAERLEHGAALSTSIGDPLPGDVLKRAAPSLRLATAMRRFLADLEQLKAEQESDARRTPPAATYAGPTVLVSMPRSVCYQGTHYGPGSAIRVPVGLQEACNLPVVEEPLATDGNSADIESSDVAA